MFGSTMTNMVEPNTVKSLGFQSPEQGTDIARVPHPGMQGAGMSPNHSTVPLLNESLQHVFIITSNCSQSLSAIMFHFLTPVLLLFISRCVEGNMLSARLYLLSSEWRLSVGQAGAVTPSQTVSLSAQPGS